MAALAASSMPCKSEHIVMIGLPLFRGAEMPPGLRMPFGMPSEPPVLARLTAELQRTGLGFLLLVASQAGFRMAQRSSG